MFDATPAFVSKVQDELNDDPNAGTELGEVYVAMKRSGAAAQIVFNVGTKIREKKGPKGAGPADVAAVVAAAAFQLGYRTALAQLKEEEKSANVIQ